MFGDSAEGDSQNSPHYGALSECYSIHIGHLNTEHILVKRILNKHGYPPDLQEAAVKTVLAQAELLYEEWV